MWLSQWAFWVDETNKRVNDDSSRRFVAAWPGKSTEYGRKCDPTEVCVVSQNPRWIKTATNNERASRWAGTWAEMQFNRPIEVMPVRNYIEGCMDLQIASASAKLGSWFGCWSEPKRGRVSVIVQWSLAQVWSGAGVIQIKGQYFNFSILKGKRDDSRHDEYEDPEYPQSRHVRPRSGILPQLSATDSYNWLRWP